MFDDLNVGHLLLANSTARAERKQRKKKREAIRIRFAHRKAPTLCVGAADVAGGADGGYLVAVVAVAGVGDDDIVGTCGEHWDGNARVAAGIESQRTEVIGAIHYRDRPGRLDADR